jgi:hypothetical protein
VSEQTGIVVEAEGGVLTVFRLPPREGLTVTVKGETLPAIVEAFDPLTGAALLRIEADGLTTAPAFEDHGISEGGERVLVAWQDAERSGLYVEGMTAVRDGMLPEDGFALLAERQARHAGQGAVVLTLDGFLMGLSGSAWYWPGNGFAAGGPPPQWTTTAGVQIGSAIALLDGDARPNAETTPRTVAYYGQGWTRFVDTPVTREAIVALVQEELTGVGPAVEIEWLGGPPRYHAAGGTVLEMLFHEPQELTDAESNLLGAGQYIAFWWRRGAGQPDVVLCGRDEDHVGAAFQTHGLGSLEPLMEAQPSTSRFTVQPAQPVLISVSSRLLVQEYEDDPDQADRQFRHATYQIEGQVVDVAANENQTTVRLQGASDGDAVCTYDNHDTPEVGVGERIGVRGVVVGLADSGDVLLDRCQLAQTEAGRLLEDEPRAVLRPRSGPAELG